MQKRSITIGTYNTAGLWTLTSWSLSRAVANEEYATVPGHNGPLDLSTVLTDGEPFYGSREFTAILECSEGTRLTRETQINQMVNQLDGWRHNIILPDDPNHYISGRIRVERLYNDPAHASVQISATCDPWRYNNSETVVVLTATTTEQTASLINNGRQSVVPAITVTGGDVRLVFRANGEERAVTVPQGEYRPEELAHIYLKTGSSPLRYSGSGQIILRYREAVL